MSVGSLILNVMFAVAAMRARRRRYRSGRASSSHSAVNAVADFHNVHGNINDGSQDALLLTDTNGNSYPDESAVDATDEELRTASVGPIGTPRSGCAGGTPLVASPPR